MTTGQVPAPDWRPHAARLAGRLAHPASRWHGPVAGIPRHLLVPRWFERSGGTWELREGTADPGAWMQAAYHATGSLVTQVGRASCRERV